jgi:sigma-B regulation protein RsbU (phosphoserine phosphatase)
MAKLNDSLCEFTGPMDRFVTLAAVILDPASHTATMMSGGHGSPLLWRPSRGEVVEAMPKDVGGPPLGMFEGIDFEAHRITLAPGESLILFTDGVNESMNARGEEFTMDAVIRVIKAAGTASPQQLGEKLVAAVKQHAAGRPDGPHDDITVVVVGRRS